MRPALVVAATAAASIIAVAPMAHAGTTKYASPTGTGTACTAAAPCGLRTALTHMVDNEELILLSGSYRTPATAFTVSLSDGGHPANIHGDYGQPPPVIYSKAQNAFGVSNGSTLSHLTVETTGSGYGLSGVGAYVDHVEVVATAPGALACSIFGPLVDSLCVSAGAGGVAVSYFNSANSDVTTEVSLRGVTAIADGANGIAVRDEADTHVTLHLTMTNTIAEGAQYDVVAKADAVTANAAITTTNCDYSTTQQLAPTGTATITASGQVQAAPRFVFPANVNFQEKAGSPTVNAGTGDSATDTDLAGNPRILGSHPDIGAYERLQPPSAHGVKLTKASRHGAHLTAKVNPKGLATQVHAVATHHGHKIRSSVVGAGNGLTPKSIHLTLKGLAHHTTYHVHVVASNSAGAAKSKSKSVHTK